MSDPVAEAAAQLAEQPAQNPADLPQEPAVMTLPEAQGELPNAALAAGEPTAEQVSATSAAGADTASTSAESFVEPLHVRVASHLEAIFQMVKTDVERAPTEAATHAAHVKTHIGDVLHRISNGMAVAEGELVQKLEALYRAL
ncbi:hypothetical protein [Paraburkholderia phenoliruptrix]|uniref:hypothetical protein n=1 Tax=Paraburkholderia phenoliruptrix TaxID=252970 RepID=UPI00286608E0|nr:hypothetical protein [Paraburkholderia phenoliruptrix]MDR6393044.1 hypothetical protein [Paraburkholderia phenoliruptrix]